MSDSGSTKLRRFYYVANPGSSDSEDDYRHYSGPQQHRIFLSHNQPKFPTTAAPDSYTSTTALESFIFVTSDSERYVAVDVSGARTAIQIRELILTKLHIYDDDENHPYSIYQTEIGAYAMGEALTSDRLLALCRDHGDSKGTLKFFVSHSSASVHEPPTPIPAVEYNPIPPVLPHMVSINPLRVKRRSRSRNGSFSSTSENLPLEVAAGYEADLDYPDRDTKPPVRSSQIPTAASLPPRSPSSRRRPSLAQLSRSDPRPASPLIQPEQSVSPPTPSEQTWSQKREEKYGQALSPIPAPPWLSPRPKDRVMHPRVGYLATKLVDTAPDRTSVIPREVLEPKETELPAPRIRNSINPSVPRRPLEISSTISEIANEDEPESLTTPNANQAVQPSSQNSWRDTPPWILASRKRQAPQKPLDTEFMTRMASLRRQADGASLSSASSTPQRSLIGSRTSFVSDLFSESSSIASPFLEVDFSPTPVFRDEIPKGLVTKVESSFFVAQKLKGRSASLVDSSLAQHPPTPTGSVRRGYWNRRGDHLTPHGYIVFPPPSMQYPGELRTYPFENEGYQDHHGQFIAYVRRPELPQSLPKHGNPPERPYESFVSYL